MSINEYLQRRVVSAAGYKIEGKLGRGVQKIVFSAKYTDGKQYAVYCYKEGTDPIPEKDLIEILPDYVKRVTDLRSLFDEKPEKKEDRYFKYLGVPNKCVTIEFDNDEIQKNLFNCLWADEEAYHLNVGFMEGQTPYEWIHDFVKVYESHVENFKAVAEGAKRSRIRGFLMRKLKNEGVNLNDVDVIFNDVMSVYHVFSTFIADQGTANDYCKKLLEKKNLILYMENLRKVAKHTLKALGALHAKGYVHRDLHADNVLIGEVKKSEASESKIKSILTDFGVCAKVGTEEDYTVAYDVKRVGFGLLVPLFWEFYSKGSKYPPGNIHNLDCIPQIRAKLKASGISENFADFLVDLKAGKFADAKKALEHVFIKEKQTITPAKR